MKQKRENDNQINGGNQKASRVRRLSTVNGSATSGKTGAGLTQSRSPSDHIKKLYAKRAAVGPKSGPGGILSNLAEQMLELPYEQPDWVSHPMQTLQYRVKQQIKFLETVK